MLTITRRMKKQLTRRHWRRLWGQRRMAEPAFVDKALGDGMQLLGITPLNTRPHYYLIRVDSSWETSSNYDSPCVSDHMDEIYDAIEDEFYKKYAGIEKDEKPNPWPALDDESGSSWWNADDLLDQFKKKGKKRVQKK